MRRIFPGMTPIIGLLLLLAGILALPGCLAWNDSGADNGASEKRVVISGSTSMEEMNNALAEAFQADHPGISVKVQALGSSEGILAAHEGVADLGASSRQLKDEEKAAYPELNEVTVAVDGIAIIVNPANPVCGLSREELRDIYSGALRNWKDLGGQDHEITVIRREDGSGTLGAFCELALGTAEKNAAFWRLSIIQNSTGAIINTVASDPNAIGFISMSVLDERVKALYIDGVAPETGNVLNGSYTLQRPYIFVTSGDPRAEVQDFLDYTLSPEGQQVISEAHAIPVSVSVP